MLAKTLALIPGRTLFRYDRQILSDDD